MPISDGDITLEDLQYVNKAFEWNLDDGSLDDWLKKSDGNHDGKVNFNEFLKRRKEEREFMEVEM